MKKAILIVTIFLATIATTRAQWTPITVNTTAKLDAIHFIDAQTGFCGGGFTGVRKTVNGGTTWTTVSTQNARDFSFFNTTNAYIASVVGSSMAKTINGGTTWTSITPPTSNSLWGVAATSATTAYFIGTGGVLWKTANGGTTVTVLNSGTTGQLNDIVFTNATTGYILEQSGKIRKTTNSGTTWTVVYTGTILFTEMYFVDQNIGYAVGAGGKVLKTTDAGATWNSLTTNSTSYLQGVNFFDANSGIVVGTGGTILYTSDGGLTWVAQTSGTTKDLYDVAMLTASSAVVVGDTGTILKSGNLLSIPANDFSNTKITILSNPVVSELKIESKSDIQNIQIFDLFGKSLFSADKPIKGETYSFNVDFLKEGIYLVAIKTIDNHYVAEKIVKTVK